MITLSKSMHPRPASRITPRLFATALWLTTAASSFGLGTRIVDQNPEATARGDAFAATADNPSAVYYNPAGISQLAGTELLLGGYGITFKTKSHLDVGGSFSNDEEWQGAPQFFVTTKLPNVPITLGLGIYAPFGFKIEYPDDVPFRTLAKKGSIEFLAINPVVSIQITRSLSFGFGPSINYGHAMLARGVLARGDEFKFEGEDWSLGGNAGLLWKPHRMHSFGLTYFSPSTFDFDGTSHLRYDDVILPIEVAPGVVRNIKVAPGVNTSEKASARFHFPQHVVLGYSFRPTEDWNFEVNVDWTDWDSLNSVKLEQKSGNVVLPFNWRSSFLYEFGATRRIGDWRLSLGYVYSENSVPNESFNPLIPDGDRHIVSAGVGRNFGHASVDLAYQFTYGGKRNISQGTVADGDYRFESHALTLSLGYHF